MRSWMTDQRSDSATLLYQIADAAADAGCLHLSWLDCGGSVIATHLGLEHRGVLHWYVPSYAMEWGKYAPGRLLLLKLLEWSVDHRLSGFDFMRGEEPYKSRLANSHQHLTDFVFASSHAARLAGPWLIPWYVRRHARAATGYPASAELVPEDP
jgi:CelD/BcsL family acetyltransferase involved in cellulose biosynthesis